MELLALASALVIGALLAIQASANLQLNKAVGTPYGAATLQLAIAATLLALLAVASGSLAALADLPTVDLWKLLGGIASPIYITSGILLFPRIGALASVGLFVTGQMIASVTLDVGGLIGLDRRPFTVAIALGAAAVLAGITIVVRSQLRSPDGRVRGRAGGWPGLADSRWLLLGLVAGAVLPVQGAVNAALRTEIDRPLAVGAFSFVVATTAIGIVLLVLLALRRTPRPRLRQLGQMPWWGWLGGAAAATYVTATFLLIPTIGAATTVALTITGQQLASALVDHHGLFRLPARPLTSARLTGLALLTGGSAIVQLAG
jgi:bacterial/archaeal transporter family-2 protein